MDKANKLCTSLAKALSEGKIDVAIENIEKLINIDAEIQFRILPKHPKKVINILPDNPQPKKVNNDIDSERTLLPPAHEPRKAVFTNPPPIKQNILTTSSHLSNLQNSEFDPLPDLLYKSTPNMPLQEEPPMKINDLPKPFEPKIDNNPPFLQENPNSISTSNISKPQLKKIPLSQNNINELPQAPNLNPNVIAPQVPAPILDLDPNIIADEGVPNIYLPEKFNIQKKIEPKGDIKIALDEEIDQNFIPPENNNNNNDVRMAELTEEELEKRKQDRAELKFTIAKQLVELAGADHNTALKISEKVSSIEAAFELFFADNN